MNAAKIRSWLIPKPRPSTVRVSTGRKVDMLAVGGVSWLKLALSIEAMQPDLLEALDDNGQVLRACRPSELDDEPEAEAEPVKPPASAYDPETVRWELFAKLLADAYGQSNKTAFERLAQIAEIGARRAEAAQKTAESYERQRRLELEQRIEAFEEQVATAGGDENLLGQMVKQFFGGQQTAGVPTPTNGKGH